MRALFIEAPGQPTLGSLPEPKYAADELLLRVQTVGFCGSDLNTFRGLNPLVSYPRVPGHEVAAVVAAIGTEVPAGHFREGMTVTVVPYTACGRCAACRRGRSNACRDNQTLGVQRDGALTEWIAAPWTKVLSAEGLLPRELALVEPLSVGFHAASRGRVEAGDRVMVIGCGAVGLGAVAAAASVGAEVIAIDVDPRKLDLGRAAGASHTLDNRRVSLHEALRELTEGEGPDVVIEAVGLPETFLVAVQEVAFTGRVVYIGYAKAPVAYDTAQFVKKELDILGSRNATPQDFQAVIDLLASGAFPSESAVTRVVALEEAADALRAWSEDPASVTRIHVNLF
ncbi:MAG TPA: zinc-binding alcohol dehydrogenase family protein [Longimicrobiaceae bacterium]